MMTPAAPTSPRTSRPAPSTGASASRHPSRLAGILALVLAILGTGFGPASAQGSRLSLEVRGGAALPVGSFEDGGSLGEPVESGASFGARFVYRTATTTALQLGFSQDRASCGTCPAGSPYVATLWDAGMRVGLGLGEVHSWILLGVVFGRVERDLELDGRVTSAQSPLEAGGMLGVGFDAPLAGTLRIAPAVRWVGLNTRFPERDLLRMRYAVLDLGVVVGF